MSKRNILTCLLTMRSTQGALCWFRHDVMETLARDRAKSSAEAARQPPTLSRGIKLAWLAESEAPRTPSACERGAALYAFHADRGGRVAAPSVLPGLADCRRHAASYPGPVGDTSPPQPLSVLQGPPPPFTPPLRREQTVIKLLEASPSGPPASPSGPPAALLAASHPAWPVPSCGLPPSLRLRGTLASAPPMWAGGRPTPPRCVADADAEGCDLGSIEGGRPTPPRCVADADAEGCDLGSIED